MKKLMCALLFIICSHAFLVSQEQNLILRRIFFTPVNTEKATGEPLLSEIPDLLYSLITSREPVIRTENAEEAHSRIDTTVEKKGENNIEISVRLFEKETLVESAVSEFSENTLLYKDLKEFIEQAVSKFIPHLGKVKPKIKISEVTHDEETKKMVEKIEFAEHMATGNEIELWIGNLSKNMTTGQGTQVSIRLILPVILEYNLYLDKHSGFKFAFLFERSDAIPFSAYSSGSSDIPEKSMNTFLLPGFGYTVRTLGRLSTGFSIILFAGPVHVEAVEPLTYFGILPGDSVWIFYMSIAFKLSLCYNVSPDFSLRLQTGFYMNPLAIASMMGGFDIGYDPIGAMLQYQLLSIGASYRF